MKIVFLPSAAKNGYTEADALNAITNYQRYLPEFEPSRVPGRPAPNLYIGPALNNDILEVFTVQVDPETIVFHCMKLRGKIYLLSTQSSN